MRTDILARAPEIEGWISEHRPKAYIARELQCKAITLDGYLERLGIEYRGNKGAKGHKISPYRRPVEDYLVLNGPFIHTNALREKLIATGIKEHRCEGCDGIEWRDKPIPLELHHLDGHRFNNLLKNLELLCPNCHAQTPNHAGRGKHGRRAALAQPAEALVLGTSKSEFESLGRH